MILHGQDARTRWNSPGEVPWRSRTAEMLKQFDFCWTPTPGGRIEKDLGKQLCKALQVTFCPHVIFCCHACPQTCRITNLSYTSFCVETVANHSTIWMSCFQVERSGNGTHKQVGCDWGRLCTGSLSDCTFCRLYTRLTARFLDLSCQHGVECLWRASFEERQLQICRSKWKGGACRDLSAARNWRCLARDSLAQRCSVRFQRIRRAAEFVESDDFGTSLPNDW